MFHCLLTRFGKSYLVGATTFSLRDFLSMRHFIVLNQLLSFRWCCVSWFSWIMTEKSGVRCRVDSKFVHVNVQSLVMLFGIQTRLSMHDTGTQYQLSNTICSA